MKKNVLLILIKIPFLLPQIIKITLNKKWLLGFKKNLSLFAYQGQGGNCHGLK